MGIQILYSFLYNYDLFPELKRLFRSLIDHFKKCNQFLPCHWSGLGTILWTKVFIFNEVFINFRGHAGYAIRLLGTQNTCLCGAATHADAPKTAKYLTSLQTCVPIFSNVNYYNKTKVSERSIVCAALCVRIWTGLDLYNHRRFRWLIKLRPRLRALLTVCQGPVTDWHCESLCLREPLTDLLSS